MDVNLFPLKGKRDGKNKMKTVLITLFLSMLPVSELRGAIPYGIIKGLPLWKVLTVSICGNLIPVIPLYFFLDKLLVFISKYRWGRKFKNYLISHAKSKSKIIEVYKTIGLAIFVGIPLPITGAWTGTIASVFLRLKFKYYITGIISGVLIAAFIVSSATLGAKFLFIPR